MIVRGTDLQKAYSIAVARKCEELVEEPASMVGENLSLDGDTVNGEGNSFRKLHLLCKILSVRTLMKSKQPGPEVAARSLHALEFNHNDT